MISSQKEVHPVLGSPIIFYILINRSPQEAPIVPYSTAWGLSFLSHHQRSSLYIEICLDSFLLIHTTHEFFQFSHWIGMDFLRSFSNFGLNILCWVATYQRFFLRSLEKRLIGILLPKLFWPNVRKNCSSDREKLLWFEAEGREFTKILRSLEQFIQTVKGQNNFW